VEVVQCGGAFEVLQLIDLRQHPILSALLHLDRHWTGGNHYVGYAWDIARRVRQHRAGDGTDYMHFAVRHRIVLPLVRVWPNAGKDVETSLTALGPVG
jgi:hypothetical protein